MTKVTKNDVRANRALPRGQLRDRIFRAAIDVFRDRGYDASTIEQVARVAGVAKGTLFNFFPSKSAILLEHYHSLDRQFGHMSAAMDPGDPYASLVRFFEGAEQLMRSQGSLIDDIVREVARDSTMREANDSSGRRDRGRWSEYVVACQAAGTIAADADPEIVGLVLADLWSGSVREWIRTGKSDTLKENLAAKLRVVLAGLEPRRRPRRRAGS